MKRGKQQGPRYRGPSCSRPCCTFTPASRCKISPALTCPNCQTSPLCLDAQLPNTMPRASSSPRASPIWSRLILTLVPSGGRAVRSSNWSFHRHIDDTLAPRGLHVASLFCQHVAPKLPDGSSWDDHRETVADLMIETVNDHAPNFRRSVLARQIFSPLDLERTFGLHRRRYIPWSPRSAANLLGASDIGPCGLSRSDRGSLFMRFGRPSGRRRHRRARPQCGARNPARLQAQTHGQSAIAKVTVNRHRHSN